MDNYKSGEVVLLYYPFSDESEMKLRPALVLLDTGDYDIIVARITGQNVQVPFDVELKVAGSRFTYSISSPIA